MIPYFFHQYAFACFIYENGEGKKAEKVMISRILIPLEKGESRKEEKYFFCIVAVSDFYFYLHLMMQSRGSRRKISVGIYE